MGYLGTSDSDWPLRCLEAKGVGGNGRNVTSEAGVGGEGDEQKGGFLG